MTISWKVLMAPLLYLVIGGYYVIQAMVCTSMFCDLSGLVATSPWSTWFFEWVRFYVPSLASHEVWFLWFGLLVNTALLYGVSFGVGRTFKVLLVKKMS